MENMKRGNIFEMTWILLEIVEMVLALPGAVVAIIEIVKKLRHQKSNRPDQG